MSYAPLATGLSFGLAIVTSSQQTNKVCDLAIRAWVKKNNEIQ